MGQEKDLLEVALERRPYTAPDQEGLRGWRSPSRGIVLQGFSASPPSDGTLASVDDWEQIDPPYPWDHDHCEFCGSKFEETARAAERLPADPSILTEGYVTVDPEVDEWVCERCFEDFKDEFNWSVKDSGT